MFNGREAIVWKSSSCSLLTIAPHAPTGKQKVLVITLSLSPHSSESVVARATFLWMLSVLGSSQCSQIKFPSQPHRAVHGLRNVCKLTYKAFLCDSRLLKLLLNSFTQWSDASVRVSQRGCHTSLERTDGTNQSVQSQIHLACFHQGSVWTHRHTKHNSWLR